MKKTLILYGSPKQYSNAHRPVNPYGGERKYFVRVEYSPYDLGEALAHAKPIAGETVLNTVEIP